MRIIYISSADLEIHDFKFLQKIVEAGHELYLITHYSEKEIPEHVRALNGIKILCYDNQIALSAGADKYPVFTRKFFCWFAFIKSYLRLKSDIKKIKPDILHAGWVQGDGLLGAISNFRPFVLMPWGSDILIDPDKNKRLMLKTKYVLSKADYIIPDCEAVKNRIIQLSGFDPDKIVVFPWGIDLDLFKPSKIESQIKISLGWQGKKVLIMPRSFCPIYGVEYFLNALPEIVEKEPDVRVLLLGSGPLESKFKQILTDLKLNEYVYFGGMVANGRMPEYLHSADIYVSSSFSDGTSVALIEAMACELPVVVTDIPSNHEWIKEGENGYLVPTKNSKMLAERIIYLLKNVELRRKMGEKNLLIAQDRADWDKNYNKLEQIYAKLFALKSKPCDQKKVGEFNSVKF